MEAKKGEPRFLYGTTYNDKNEPRETTACVIPVSLDGTEVYAVGLTKLNPNDTPDKDKGDNTARDRANEVADAYADVIAKYAKAKDTKIMNAAELGDLEKILKPAEIKIVPAAESEHSADGHD